MDIWASLLAQWQQQSLIEVFAVLLAVAYVWLASEESIWCWPAGFISTALFVYVYWEVSLLFQTLLNVYYMAMAVWGFIVWRKSGEQKLRISRMSAKQHLAVLSTGSVLSLLTYIIASYWFDYSLIGIDIVVTIFSLIATLLTVRKCLECWYYWSFINLLSFYMVWQAELYFTALLMVIYLIIAIRGVIHWFTIFNEEQAHMSEIGL